MIFDAAAQVAQHVPGWLVEPAEAQALYNLACTAPGPVVEVGTYCGKSTCYLAAAAQDVIAIDPHDEAHYNPTQRAVLAGRSALDVAELAWEVLGLRERITVLRATSEAAALDVPGEVGMVFIDGDHRPAGVRLDLDLYAPRVVAGGVLALHDWGIRGDEAEAWDVSGVTTAWLAEHEWPVASRGLTVNVAWFVRGEPDG